MSNVRPRAVGASLTLAAGLVLAPAPETTANRAVEAAASGDRVAAAGMTWTPGRSTRLSAAGWGHWGSDALRMRTVRLARARAAVTPRILDTHATGTRMRARVWVRTNRAGQRVRLVLREHRAGATVAARRRGVRLDAHEWTRVRVAITKTRSRSRLSLQVVGVRMRRSHRLLVDDVRVAAREHDTRRARTLSNGCRYNKRGVPACGTYLGATYKANHDPTPMENAAGRRLGVHRAFFRADQVDWAMQIARADLQVGRLPWISFKLPYSWENMVAGRGDAWARNLADRLDALPGPVWVAFHHEPEWDGDIQAWRRMQERLVPIVRGSTDNVAYTVIVTGWNQFYGDPSMDLDVIWPRGVRIDVAGFDVYNQYGVVKDGKKNTTGTNLRTAYFEKIAPWAEEKGMAWGLAETGFTDEASEVDPDWIKRTYTQMNALGGVAFAYFNTTLNSIASWHLGTQAKIDGYARAAARSPLLPRG